MMKLRDWLRTGIEERSRTNLLIQKMAHDDDDDDDINKVFHEYCDILEIYPMFMRSMAAVVCFL